MTYPKILSRSFPEANVDLPGNAGSWGVVSIGEPGTDTPLGFNPQNPMHLRLEFHDIVEELSLGDRVFTPPSEHHIEELLSYAKISRGLKIIYCHCVAGISRSTAAAYILRSFWGGPGSEAEALVEVYADRPQAWPNERMVSLADQVMDRNGKLMAALVAYDS